MFSARRGSPSLFRYLCRHPRISIGGKSARLQWATDMGCGSTLFREEGGRIILSFDPRLETESQLLRALRRLAAVYLPPRVEELGNRFGLRAHGVSVRDQRSRWGSCSETGGLSLNWRLILLPPRLQDHVILHELAHTRHFDHSRAFYSFLKAMDPRMEAHSGKLDVAYAHLMDLGRR